MFKCKICGKKYNSLETLYNHIESKHNDMIPKDMSVQQYYYYMKTGKTNGNCVMCKQMTTWNPNTRKYNRFCNDPKCKEEYVKIMKGRMIAKYGKAHLLNDPNKQREMLANRSISGTYTWSNRKFETTYTGSYELDFLKTLDDFFNWDPQDISMPSPHTYTYKYNGEDKFYIPDVFIHSLDLEIEIKDGGDNPNNHHKIQDVDKEKEKLKDEVLRSQKLFHYVKITNKNYENFFEFLHEIKKGFEKYGDDKKIPRIFKTEDIKTDMKVVKESSDYIEESGLLKTAVKKLKTFNKKSYREINTILSLRYDLVKNSPEELQSFLSMLIKGASGDDDFNYVRMLAGKSETYYHNYLRKRPELKDPYAEYYKWIKKGGMDDEIKDRKNDLKESFEFTEESYLRNKKDLYVNFELFESGQSNVCLVTGLSGSGKTTLSNELCKKYNATCIEMDLFEHPDMKPGEFSNKNIYNKYFMNKMDVKSGLMNNELSEQEVSTEMSNVISYVLKYCNEHPNEKFVIEGLQIFADVNPEYIKGKPIVFVNTSMINSMIRKVKRDNHKYKVADLFKWYINDEKKFEGFKDEILEEKFEPDKFLVWFDKPIKKIKGGKIKVHHGSIDNIEGDVIDPISFNVGDDLSRYKDMINYHVKRDTYGLRESFIINTMKESSISIPQMSLYLQNEYEEEMKHYLNTYKKYYNEMLREQPSAVKHINEDIKKALIVIDGLASKGVENNLVQFAKDDLGEIVKASKHGKPVKVYEEAGSIILKLVYDNPNKSQIFSLNDLTSKIIVNEEYVIYRDKIGSHCSVTPFYQEIEYPIVKEFQLELKETTNISDLQNKMNKGVNIANLHKFDDKTYKFINELSLKLFGSYPTKVLEK